MVLQGKRILVMGLLNTQSIAWAIGQRAASLGAEITYTVQNERFRDTLLRRAFRTEGLDVDDYRILSCDVTSDDDLQRTFSEETGHWDGIAHCIAYGKPETCLANTLFEAPREDVVRAFEISAASLAFVAGAARNVINRGGSIVTLTFASDQAYPSYSWMGICKAALEATARYLARDLGPQQIRVNCLSAGPQDTMAASKIPGFAHMSRVWPGRAPLGWDVSSRGWVADNACYLLSDFSGGVTGETLHVDGGFHAMAMENATSEASGRE